MKSGPLLYLALSALGLSLVYHEKAVGYGFILLGLGFVVPRIYTPRVLGLWMLSLILLGFVPGCFEPIREGYGQPGPKWAAVAICAVGSFIAMSFSRKEEDTHAELVG